MKKKNVVYIIGHRNPDTDSICSAIAYADVKNRTAEGSFVPMRAGQINEETEFVLNYFHTEVPAYLPDAAARVGEIEIHEIPGANRQISVKQAWERMKGNVPQSLGDW
jgi:manganese-dependent inorganic pyrophosphatase